MQEVDMLVREQGGLSTHADFLLLGKQGRAGLPGIPATLQRLAVTCLEAFGDYRGL